MQETMKENKTQDLTSTPSDLSVSPSKITLPGSLLPFPPAECLPMDEIVDEAIKLVSSSLDDLLTDEENDDENPNSTLPQ